MRDDTQSPSGSPAAPIEAGGLASPRRRQAEREVGVTRVSRSTAVGATLLFLATIVAVAVIDTAAAERPFAWLAELAAGATRARELVAAEGPLAANRAVLASIDAAEAELEDASSLRARLLPIVQWTLTAGLGAGSADAIPGDDGWLFYRPDVEYVTAPGFLAPRRLEARRLAGDAWRPPVHPDPRPALVALHRALEARGIELVVMPTPVKPSLYPGRLAKGGRLPAAAAPGRRSRGGPASTTVTTEAGRASPASPPPLQNASYPDLLAALAADGIAVFDPGPLLAARKASSPQPFYLQTDTHWAPAAIDLVAAELAKSLAPLLSADVAEIAWRRRPVTVEGRGDTAEMLPLPAGSPLYPPQRVEADLITDPRGRLWRPDRAAEVLVLGDSFTNVFSDPALGWGQGAGLAEQLAYHLRRPVDRIAQSAGGAHASREALARDLGRLDGKRVVVYQFATRELASGDWKPVSLPSAP